MIHILMDLLAAILALSGAGSAEEMGEEEMERYRHFAEHPLQINRLPAARLRASGIFTDYQLAALEDYRARNGDILEARKAYQKALDAKEAENSMKIRILQNRKSNTLKL